MSTGIVTRRKSAMHIDNSYGIDVVAANTNLVSKRVLKGEPFSTQIVCDEGYSVYEITIKMGGVDITSTAYDPTYNMITIPSVTGDVDIECYAMHTMPSDYIRVDGIKNPSDAYLNTDYTPSKYTKVIVDALPDSNNAYIVADKTSSWTSTYGTGVRRYLTSVRAFFNNEEQNLSNPYTVGERFVVICDNYNGKLYYNGTLKKSFQRVNANDSYALCLFSRDRGNESSNSAGTIIYRTYIYEYSTTSYVRYYIPCLNDSGVAGFWDAARGVFQGSSNSTAFEEVFEGTTISSQFTKRTTADGATLALPTAKVTSVKGNTLVWNQLVTPAATTVRGITTTVSDGVITINGTSLPNSGGRTTPLTTTNPSLIANHKYYICTPTRLSRTAIQWYLSNSSTAAIVANVPEGRNIVTITTTATCIFGGNFDGSASFNYKGYIIIIDLTKMFGAGNEPTKAIFEQLFDVGNYTRNGGSLLNFTATSLASKNAVGTTIWNEALDVTTITGKVDGEGESVAIFPDGMKRAGNYYDEIVKEDGVWVAYKRVNKYTVDMSSGTWSAWGQTYVSQVLLGENAAHQSGSNLNPVSDKMYVAQTRSMNGTDLPQHFGVNNTGVYVSATDYNNRANIGTFTICYPLGTPIKYVLDNPLPEYYKALTGGVEQILPENGATPTTSPADMNITYKTIE